MIGTSVVEFFARFPNSAACAEHVFLTRWGTHTPCPRCGLLGRWSPMLSSGKFQHSCRRQVSPRENTAFYRSNSSLMAWFYALLLLANSAYGIRGSFIRKQLGLGAKGTHRLCTQLRKHIAAFSRVDRLGGPGVMVHVDEVQIKYSPRWGDHSDQLSAIVFGCACADQVMTCVIPDRSKMSILRAIDLFVEPGSIIVSDAHASYKTLPALGWRHIVINHARAYSNFAGVTNNPIETYWVTLKRTLGAYGLMKPEYLWLYLAEAEFRYNRRRSKISAFEELISAFPDVSADALERVKRRFLIA